MAIENTSDLPEFSHARKRLLTVTGPMGPSSLWRAPPIVAQNAMVNEIENPEIRYFGKRGLFYEISGMTGNRSPVWAYPVFS